MYISKALSNLGAWELIRENHPSIFNELGNLIEIVQQPKGTKLTYEKSKSVYIPPSPRDLLKQFSAHLDQNGWSKGRIKFGNQFKSNITEIDGVKEKIGVEVTFSKFAYAESDIFVKFPIFIRAQIINVAILIMPMRQLAHGMGLEVSSFEMVEHRLREITPLLPRYPFVIIGISDKKSKTAIEELSSDLDLYLIENIGVTYSELKLQQERQNCDFKVTLPAQAEKVAKELCAFANNSGGGVLLVGADNSGNKIGIPVADKDEIQRRIGNVAKDSCEPSVIIGFRPFEIDGNPERCLLAVRINEIERKPCMSQGRIFIRDNATAVPANPDQVRRLLFGNLK